MQIQHLFIRIARFYKNDGLSATVRQFILHFRRIPLQNKYIIYCSELMELSNEKPKAPPTFIIECNKSETDISEADKKLLCKEISQNQLEDRFSKGAFLWLIKHDKSLAGFVWSIIQKPVEPYFFPLTKKDVHLFDNLILPQYRGRGVNTILINHVLFEFKRRGFLRAFIETRAWNSSEIKSLIKTPFYKFAEARKFHFFGRNFSSWSNAKVEPLSKLYSLDES